jgi:hypothetical protein
VVKSLRHQAPISEFMRYIVISGIDGDDDLDEDFVVGGRGTWFLCRFECECGVDRVGWL